MKLLDETHKLYIKPKFKHQLLRPVMVFSVPAKKANVFA
jgi:hypothetical protein